MRTAAQEYRRDRQEGQEQVLELWSESAGTTACGKVLVTLHLGDLDPSGVHVPRALAEDVAAFAAVYGGRTELVRVAVTEDQVARYGLQSAPPKATDRRSFTAAGTTQLEALPPDRLAELVRAAIEERFNMAVYAEVLEQEAAERAELLHRLGQ